MSEDHKILEKSFKNELGNDIYLKIESRNDIVQIFMEGPTSTGDWTMTRQEAREIQKLLTKME